MRFANPQMLWLLLVVPPAVILFLWWAWRKRQELMRHFIQARLLPNLTVGLSPGRQKLGFALLVLAYTFLILALARPQWGFTWEEARLRGLDIVVGVDVSKSMLAEDVAPNRLARARLAVLDLVRQAQSDRLGLVAFAGDAFLQCPLTIDESAFRQTLDTLDVGVIPQGGTAIAAAIRTALTAFKEGESYKVLVLFTDGEDQDSGAVQAAREAAEKGLKIFTIGIGTPEGEILRDHDRKGRIDYIRDPEGNVVKSRLNEEMLREIAEATDGGFYLPLRGSQTVETLYSQALAPLPKTDRREKLLKRYHERYHWPLAIAIFLLLAEYFLALHQAQTKVGPKRAPIAARSTARAAATAAIAVVILLQATMTASADTALRDYRAGRYDDALRKYRDRLDRKNPDPRLHFNAGASAYRDGKLKDAVNEFSEALKSSDLNLQQSAYYNRGNTQFYLGQGAEDPSKRSELWKKSIQDFGSAMKLNPKDQDAKFNQELVKKMLEELQQQQPQQQSPDNQNKEEQDQKKQQQQQQSSNPEQKDQEQQNQQEENQSQSQDKQEAQSQPSQQDQQQQQEQQQAQQSDQSKSESQQAQTSDQQQNPQPSSGQEQQEGQQGEKENQASASTPQGQMTPEQARQLLDSQKGEEKALPMAKANGKKQASANRPIRDW